MGIINRLGRITIGKIERFLDSVENHDTIIPQLILEMQENVKLAANAEAKALTATKSSRRKLDEANGRMERLKKGIELAIRSNDSDAARTAIAAQIESESDIESISELLKRSEQAYEDARSTRVRLSSSLDKLRLKKKELSARSAAIKAQEKCNLSASLDSNNILDVVSRMEDKITEKEAQIEIRGEVDRLLSGDVEKYKLEELIKNDEIQRRLDAMKNKNQD